MGTGHRQKSQDADLILLLISPDFMASDYCYGKEMQRALERHREGTCRVVPSYYVPPTGKRPRSAVCNCYPLMPDLSLAGLIGTKLFRMW